MEKNTSFYIKKTYFFRETIKSLSINNGDIDIKWRHLHFHQCSNSVSALVLYWNVFQRNSVKNGKKYFPLHKRKRVFLRETIKSLAYKQRSYDIKYGIYTLISAVIWSLNIGVIVKRVSKKFGKKGKKDTFFSIKKTNFLKETIQCLRTYNGQMILK